MRNISLKRKKNMQTLNQPPKPFIWSKHLSHAFVGRVGQDQQTQALTYTRNHLSGCTEKAMLRAGCFQKIGIPQNGWWK